MRVLAFVFVLLGFPATAEPAHRLGGFDANLFRQDEPRLRMPGEFAYASHRGSPADNGLILGLQNDRHDMPAASGISFGPVHAESEMVNGRRHVHYRLDGLTLLGGDIGGSVSGHGAMLTLHWSSSGN
ncbi:MAG TPA: hypothetical protein VGH02_02535 [Rhizomicrobium sp.]